MRNKNVWVLIAAAAVIGLVFLLALALPRRTASLPEALVSPAPSPQASAAPDVVSSPLSTDGAPQATPVPAKGYVLVSAATEARWYALPEEEDLVFTVRQTSGEDVLENVIHLTPQGVYMESSTCDNQDCVKQGEVTLENKSTRVLGNMVICLPHQVMIELYTPDELLAQAAQ